MAKSMFGKFIRGVAPVVQQGLKHHYDLELQERMLNAQLKRDKALAEIKTQKNSDKPSWIEQKYIELGMDKELETHKGLVQSDVSRRKEGLPSVLASTEQKGAQTEATKVKTRKDEIQIATDEKEKINKTIRAIHELDDAKSIIKRLAGNKDLSKATGIEQMFSLILDIPGSNMRNVKTELESLKGGALVEAIRIAGSAHGLTENEGKALQQAQQQVDASTDDETFREALLRYGRQLDRSRKLMVDLGGEKLPEEYRSLKTPSYTFEEKENNTSENIEINRNSLIKELNKRKAHKARLRFQGKEPEIENPLTTSSPIEGLRQFLKEYKGG